VIRAWPVSRLQWGHGDEAVEEERVGPRCRRRCAELQWGHGDEAVEEAVIASSSAAQLIASMGPRR